MSLSETWNSVRGNSRATHDCLYSPCDPLTDAVHRSVRGAGHEESLV